MVVHWKRAGGAGWRAQAAVNGVGAVLTTVVLGVVAATKFAEGAWIIIVVIPLLVVHFRSIHRHYVLVGSQLTLEGWRPEPPRHNTVVVPVSGVHRAVVEAVDYARTLGRDVRAIFVGVNPAATRDVVALWARWIPDVPLVVLESPYRSLMEPLLEHIEGIARDRPEGYITVVLPEFLPARWWHHLLHNQTALLIKAALLFKPNMVVTSVPFHLRR
jgi:hypothetical protein